MSKTFGALALTAGLAFAGAAAADETGYAFKVENASAGAAAVTVDGKSVCDLAAGGRCTVTVSTDEHAYAFSLAGGAPKAFSPGNMEMVDVCKIDTSGIHCVDTTGVATN
jgi:hypothetical protein